MRRRTCAKLDGESLGMGDGRRVQDGPVYGAGFLRSVLQGALREVPFVFRVRCYVQLSTPILLLTVRYPSVKHVVSCHPYNVQHVYLQMSYFAGASRPRSTSIRDHIFFSSLRSVS
jgi:hypothetical protein